MRVVRNSLSILLSAAAALAGIAFARPAAAGELLSVKNASANFREGPGEKHPIAFSADRYYPVEVLEKKDGWAKVKDFEGDVAWVAARLLAKQETVVIEGDRVNVRDKAGTDSEVAFKAERGEVFKVEEREGRWLRVVDANGDGGWIREDMVWGERVAAASSPKGKSKGELEDPKAAAPEKEPASAKGAPKSKGDDAADAKSSDKKGDKAEKPQKKAEKKKADKKAAAPADEAEAQAEPAEEAAPAEPKEEAEAAKPAAAEPASPKAAEPEAAAEEAPTEDAEPAADDEG